MRWRVRRQAADGFLELAFGADPPAAPGLVPGDGDVDEPLEEVALLVGRRAPGELELLVRGEVLAATDELKPLPVLRRELLRLRPGRRRCGAGSRGRTRSGLCGRRTANH